MNKTKCKIKSCRKWHPTMSDISSPMDYRLFKGCKCNSKIINAVHKYGIKPKGIKKGIVQLSAEEIEMLTFILDNPDE